jgi:hypothetical protein
MYRVREVSPYSTAGSYLHLAVMTIHTKTGTLSVPFQPSIMANLHFTSKLGSVASSEGLVQLADPLIVRFLR